MPRLHFRVSANRKCARRNHVVTRVPHGQAISLGLFSVLKGAATLLNEASRWRAERVGDDCEHNLIQDNFSAKVGGVSLRPET
jgi:hypothetical protein